MSMEKEIPWVSTGQWVPLGALREHPGNPKVHTRAQLSHLKESILAFGFLDPIGIWGECQVVEGHGRLRALRELCEEGKIRLPAEGVPVLRLDHLTSQERDAYMAAHNQLCMETEWDTPELSALLAGIDTVDLEALGLEFTLPEVEEDEAEPDRESFILAIDCEDEAELEQMKERLGSMGIRCRRLGG